MCACLCVLPAKGLPVSFSLQGWCSVLQACFWSTLVVRNGLVDDLESML